MKVYLDNSATSWPKPPAVLDAMSTYINEYGASPGRSGHGFAVRAAREVFETRELIASLFNVESSERVIFSANATHAINIALKGLLKKGDHVIITHMEHNSVRRPLKYLKSIGLIDVTIADCCEKGYVDIDKLTSCFRENTKLVVTIHGSNVSGAVMPIDRIGQICKAKGVLYMVDAAQTAGFIPIDMQNDSIDILVFTGHKKLYGPPGIGGLCIRNGIHIDTLIHGGTGSRSELDVHPDFYPDRLEAGTPNTLGILGLKAGIQYIIAKGIDSIRERLGQQTAFLINALKGIDEITLYGPGTSENRLPLVSMNVKKISPSQLALTLDSEYGIMTRAGLHCSPLAHQTLSTLPQGTVRFSLGCFTTDKEIDYTINALKRIITS
ncbi:MAG: aminotransferase class V-fold PLP-dependent enzyme [Bacteroidales bacterium]|nr:MAG: aminotransferase class V-fold PLP-dependent enzyme [Bacteroidales bacterium]